MLDYFVFFVYKQTFEAPHNTPDLVACSQEFCVTNIKKLQKYKKLWNYGTIISWNYNNSSMQIYNILRMGG